MNIHIHQMKFIHIPTLLLILHTQIIVCPRTHSMLPTTAALTAMLQILTRHILRVPSLLPLILAALLIHKTPTIIIQAL